jgi:predicted transcriptional regulator
LAALCWCLCGQSPDRQFFLDERAAGELLGVHRSTVGRWLKDLELLGLLVRTKRGTYKDGLASEFVWLWS